MRKNLALVGLFATSASAFSLVIEDRPHLAPFTVNGEGFRRLDDAVAALREGDGIILIAAGTYTDCAVVTGGMVTIQAVEPSTAIFDGGACEGKATLVLRGTGATIDGIVFQNIRVADRNGAGIRLERGDLKVVRSTFRNSEQGILTADDAAGTITIERSTFSGLGGCPDGMCSHSIYVGGYGKLVVSRVRFERGTGGHYVKSRAPVNEVVDSSFDDSAGRATNYMIDLPSGSTGTIARNVFVQGRDKENYSAFIAVAAETRDNPSTGLLIDGNTASIAPGVSRKTYFVADWSHERLTLGTNRLGAGVPPFETR